MQHVDNLFKALGLNPQSTSEIRDFAKRAGLTMKALKRYNESNLIPSEEDLKLICDTAGVSPAFVMLSMGHINKRLVEALKKNAAVVHDLISDDLASKAQKRKKLKPVHKTPLGQLYEGDCLDLMAQLPDEEFDLIFADPPFNLKKMYPSGMDDDLKEQRYIEWCEEWLEECIRLLKPGGSIFVWNLPRWNTHIAAFLNSYLTFRHWIAVDIKYSLPIQSRLYPSHYSLLYYCKGEKPLTFHPDRLPMEICPSCKADLKDYGGYKDKMNPAGINLSDVWNDIPPVRHAKYKRRKEANELSIKLLDRIIELATNEGDHVFDPFGGAGTTYAVSELKGRHWTGIELGPTSGIIERLDDLNDEAQYLEAIRAKYNHLISHEDEQERIKRGLWTCESVRRKKQEKLNQQAPLFDD